MDAFHALSSEKLSSLPPAQVSLVAVFLGLSTFLSTIDGLRDVLQHSATGMDELDERRALEQLERLRRRTIDLLPPEKRDPAAAAAEEWLRRLVEMAGPVESRGDDLIDRFGQDIAALIRAFDGHPLAHELVLGVYGVLLGRSRRELLCRSVVITAVSAFETHAATLISEWFRRYPRMLSTGEREVSLDELLDASSMQAVVDALIERRSESVLRGGFTKWAEWLEPRIKLSFADLAMDLEATREIFERRHLYVHSGGAVTRRYRQSVRSPLQIGRELSIDETYVSFALDRLVVLGVSLAVAERLQLAPDLPHLGIDVASRAVEHLMRRGRWEAVLRASEIQERVAESREDRLVAKVNLWLARKHLHGPQAIRRKVQAWNVEGLAPVFRLARHTLLDEHDEALQLASELFAQRLVDESIVDWPIFEFISDKLRDLFSTQRAWASPSAS